MNGAQCSQTLNIYIQGLLKFVSQIHKQSQGPNKFLLIPTITKQKQRKRRMCELQDAAI